MNRLQPGESRMARIDAGTRNNRTGIELEAGVTYDCVATGSWKDASIVHDANGKDVPKLRWWIVLRRVRNADWFRLIGVVDGENHLLGTHATITPSKSGELVCYANDVWFMYWNNTGSIELTVTRR
jgi:hypothetical protein